MEGIEGKSKPFSLSWKMWQFPDCQRWVSYFVTRRNIVCVISFVVKTPAGGECYLIPLLVSVPSMCLFYFWVFFFSKATPQVLGVGFDRNVSFFAKFSTVIFHLTTPTQYSKVHLSQNQEIIIKLISSVIISSVNKYSWLWISIHDFQSSISLTLC